MLSTSKNIRHIKSQITGGNFTFDNVNECVYFGAGATMVSVGKRLAGTDEIGDINSPTFSVLLYGAESWTLLRSYALVERKILRKIFRPGLIGDDFRIRANKELYPMSLG